MAASIVYMRYARNINGYNGSNEQSSDRATYRFVAYPHQSSRVAAVAELQAANRWIDRVRRRKRLVVGHQAHLQQALTRDSEKPKIVSWCCHSAPSL